MKWPQYILPLHCHICGISVGEVSLDDEMTEEAYDTWQGFCDRRCDTCLTDHGSYQELEAKYLRETNEDPAKAEQFIKANRKRADFEKELIKHKEAKEKNIKNNDIIDV